MKKIALVLIFSSLTTLMIAAAHDIMENISDPKKADQQQPTFSLAPGYFSLFNIFTKNPVTPDSTIAQSTLQEPKLVIAKN